MSSSNLANVPLDCRPLAAACDSMIHDVLLSVRRRRWWQQAVLHISEFDIEHWTQTSA